MKHSIIVRLQDMLDMIDAASEMTDGVDFAAYGSDLKLRLAVERCIEIVSDASRHVPDDAKRNFPDVPWPEIAAIGNKLRHEYHRVDDLIIWRVATKALPSLRPIIVLLLKTGGRPAAEP